ncbi:MAG: hypothetical protein ACOYT4_04500 [Nanoarchaeota archaeon]
MTIDKQKEILELRKTYLTCFEKYETKVLIACFGIVVLPLFVLWLQGKMDGILVLIIALFGCFLDLILEAWRKKSFNDLIIDIEEDKISTIQPKRNHIQEKIVSTPIIKSQKLELKEKDNELMKLAIITLLVAVMFGILQIYPDGKIFDTIGIGVVLKVVASTMLYAPFPIFLIYLILLGLNTRYEKSRTYPKPQAFFYDLGIFLTTFIFILASLFSFFIWLLVKVPTFPMSVVVCVISAGIIIGAIVICFSIRRHFKKKN